MATATLHYDLFDSDDKMEFKRVNKSLDMALCLWEITYNLKKEFERMLESNDASNADFELLDKIFEKIRENIDEHGIRVDDLIN